MNHVASSVDEAIERISVDFLRNPHKYLTEDDLRFHLCCLLLRQFGELEQTEDGDQSIALHAEVRWWGEESRTDRTDIVIFDVASLNVTPNAIRSDLEHGLIPRKGFSASKPVAAIELKLRRPDGQSDREFSQLIEADVAKLKEIHRTIGSRAEGSLVCRIVVFDKKTPLHGIEHGAEGVKVTYQFSNATQC